MATSTPINLLWSILAASILVSALYAAADQPQELVRNQTSPELARNQTSPEFVSDRYGVRLHYRCMMRVVLSSWPELDFSCKYTYEEMQHRYEKTGSLSEDYVEALRIYHNYNQSDVDIDICYLARSRCPDRIKALKARCTSTDIKSGIHGELCCRPRDIELGRYGC